jgi:hypothetical protein
MNWREISEVCYGLVHEGRHPATLYRPEWFSNPYDTGIEIWQQSGASKEDVAKVVNHSYMTDAVDAVHRFNGLGEYQNFDWSKALREAYQNELRGIKLEKIAKRLKQNEPVDMLPLFGELSAAIANESYGLQQSSNIDYSTYKPFMPCGYEPIDKTLGGIPSDGPIIIYGVTGVGKSKFATALINGLLHLYPDKKAAIYTLEMNEKHWLWRTLNLFPSMKKVLDRLYVSGSVRDIEELVAEVTAKKVDFVVLDDMDNMVKSSDASEYERIYRRVKEVCRFMSIPFFVLCQPNREAKWAIHNGERFLTKYDIAWSGAAENSAALQIAIQTANKLDMKDGVETFPLDDEQMDYIMLWKSRDGWPGDYNPTKQVGPGAVVMEHSPNWNGKPYAGKWKIWNPESGGKQRTDKKRSNGK